MGFNLWLYFFSQSGKGSLGKTASADVNFVREFCLHCMQMNFKFP